MIKGSKEFYKSQVVSELKKQLNFKSVMQVPFLKKLVLNIGLGEAKNNKAVLTEGLKALGLIAGQKAIATKARKSIAGFKIKEKMPIGVKVTLSGNQMYEYLMRLIHVAIPRIKDFHGLNNRAFDGRGNYTLGIEDINIFPEVSYMHSKLLKGMSVVFVTSTNNDRESYSFLEKMGLPFKKRKMRNG